MLQTSHRNLTPKFLRPVMAKFRSLSPRLHPQNERSFPKSAPDHPQSLRRRTLYEGSFTCTHKTLTEQLQQINQEINQQCYTKLPEENTEQPLHFRRHTILGKGIRSNRSPLYAKLDRPVVSGDDKVMPVSYNNPFNIITQLPNNPQTAKLGIFAEEKPSTKEQQQPETRSNSRCRTRLSESYSRKQTQSVDFECENVRSKNNYSVVTDDEIKDRELAYLNDLCQQLLSEQNNLKAKLRNQEDIIQQLSVKNATQPIKPSFIDFPNSTRPMNKSRKPSGLNLKTLVLNLEKVQNDAFTDLDKHANSEFLSAFSAEKLEDPQFTFRPGDRKWAECDMSPSSEAKSRSFKFPREIFSTKTRRKRVL